MGHHLGGWPAVGDLVGGRHEPRQPGRCFPGLSRVVTSPPRGWGSRRRPGHLPGRQRRATGGLRWSGRLVPCRHGEFWRRLRPRWYPGHLRQHDQLPVVDLAANRDLGLGSHRRSRQHRRHGHSGGVECTHPRRSRSHQRPRLVSPRSQWIGDTEPCEFRDQRCPRHLNQRFGSRPRPR